MTITVKLVADSISPNGDRLTTLELEYPRYIHAEFMTHRVFSRNAQSSRAISLPRYIEMMRNDPVLPIWVKDQKGMTADTVVDNMDQIKELDSIWLGAMEEMVSVASKLYHEYGIHKQIVNRLLEPFSTIKVIVSSTEWDNFFNLRISRLAQQEIYELASKMKNVIDESTPRDIEWGEYHLPYIRRATDYVNLEVYLHDKMDLFTFQPNDPYYEKVFTSHLKKISVARVARVSLLHHGEESSIEKDLDRYNQLLMDKHMSPFEHIATPTPTRSMQSPLQYDKVVNNFTGWTQHRQEVEAYVT